MQRENKGRGLFLLLAILGINFDTSLDAAGIPIRKHQESPNIILIMADDVGYECFGCYGSQQYKTPNIDRMARQGMRFEHCYSQPLCTPTRVKLMTGISNARNYSAFSVLNRDQKTIGHYFKDAGYSTAIVGKWQLFGAEHYPDKFREKGTMPLDAGFENACLWQVDLLGQRYAGPLMWIDGENKQFEKGTFGPDVATDYLIDFITSQKQKPFFAYYPMILPHSPFVPTPHSEKQTTKNQQQNFEDMVAYVDHLVGRIVDAVEDAGLGKNTLIIFTGDNGTHQRIKSTLNGRVIQGGKGLTTDAGMRVPMVAMWPETIPKGKVSTDLIDCSDFLPTLLEAARQKVPQHLDGRTFWPQLQGLPGTPRESFFCFYCPRPEKTPPVRFARDKTHKLYGDGRFYHVAMDPLEETRLPTDSLNDETRVIYEKLLSVLNSMPTEGQSLLKYPTP